MLIDGKLVAKQVGSELIEQVAAIKAAGKPCGLAVILVGDNAASQVYVNLKRKECLRLGIDSYLYTPSQDVTQEELVALIEQLNNDAKISGILIQLPLPPHIDVLRLVECIDPAKDVDGFHPSNLGKLLTQQAGGFVPCTPAGILALLSHYHISTTGKNVVILGRSNIVGKPLANLLMQRAHLGNATVTVLNTHTPNIEEHCRRADILIAALGSKHFVRADMVKPGAVVIDVGITSELQADGTKRLFGDVDFAHVEPLCSYITPVPGGVGPMTIAMLMKNTVKAAYLN